MKKILFFILITGAVLAASNQLESPVAKITLRVINEQGSPISGASVRIGFEEAVPHWGGGGVVNVKGLTNEEGKFTGEGHSMDSIGGWIEKEGYYSSFSKAFKFERALNGKWQPWNPTIDVVIKKNVNPTPMYAKRVNLGMPVLNETVGYDLFVGDWVKPYGKGTSADILLKADRNKRSEQDFDSKLTVTFPNKGDGLQVFNTSSENGFSELKSPREAPETGYQAEWIQTHNRQAGKPEQSNRDNKRAYFFRVRTILDEHGNVISAKYGKIYGDFLNFSYYLNPDNNSRNMEFDPTRNLITNLKSTERVTCP
jgi:hypothetical protein